MYLRSLRWIFMLVRQSSSKAWKLSVSCPPFFFLGAGMSSPR